MTPQGHERLNPAPRTAFLYQTHRFPIPRQGLLLHPPTPELITALHADWCHLGRVEQRTPRGHLLGHLSLLLPKMCSAGGGGGRTRSGQKKKKKKAPGGRGVQEGETDTKTCRLGPQGKGRPPNTYRQRPHPTSAPRHLGPGGALQKGQG